LTNTSTPPNAFTAASTTSHPDGVGDVARLGHGAAAEGLAPQTEEPGYLYLAGALSVNRRLINRAHTRYRWPTRPTTRRLR